MCCDKCRWWKKDDDEDNCYGLCRRYAPSPVMADINAIDYKTAAWSWPVTEDWEWCGEFTKKPKPLRLGGLSVRARRAIKGMDVSTVDEFLALTDVDILQFHGVGEVAYCEISRFQERLSGVPPQTPEEELKAEAAVKAALGL